jgi:O-antigen ligase
VEPAGSTFFWSFSLFLVLAPLYKAGNRPLPLLLLELAAIGFMVTLAVRGALGMTWCGLPRALLAALGVLLAYPLLQLVPLPDSVWRALPGHAPYAAVLEQFAGTGATGVHRAISVIPEATEYGWLALLPPLACLLAVRWLAPARVVRLLLLLAIFTGAEGLLGLMQVGAGGDSIFYLRNDQAYGTATGTFVNRNHLAAMLAMMLPVIVGLLIYSILRGRHRHRRRALAFDAEAMSQRVLVFASAVLVLLCLVFTKSRAGIATALLGLAFSSILLVRARAGWKHANSIVAALVITGVMLAALIGLAPVLEKWEPDQLRLSGEGRLALYAATLRAAIEFLPFGSGLSTFASVFPRFQVEAFGGYIDYAHNDYMQSFMELGLAAPVIVGLLLVVYVTRMTDLLRRERDRSFTVLQIAAGVGLLPMILHSVFDFSLHMPANAMWFATLAGVMLHPGREAKSTEGVWQDDRSRPRPP